MTWMSNAQLAGLNAVIDEAPELFGRPPTATFSPCQQGHGSSAECRAADAARDDDTPPCRAYRYALTREWAPDHPPAVFVMLNPSTADAWLLDPTLTRCRNYAIAWGCGGLIVLNAFALRSTDPRALRSHPDPVGPDNDQVIASVLCAGQTGPVVVGWGADPALRQWGARDWEVIRLLHAGGIEPVCLGQTKAGFPRHPLYLPADVEPSPYPHVGAYAAYASGGGHDG
jgi:hypothetical protein